jgi:hypothetical protein
MELVKKVGETTIYKKKSGRFGVQNKKNKWINGDEKAKILVDAGLIKVSVKAKAPAEAPAEVVEETAEVTEDSTEA